MLKDKKAFPWVALGVGKMIKHEIAKLCSDNVNSLLKSKGKESMGQFPWENLRKEISFHCPTLHKLLYCATTTRVRRPNQDNFVTVLVSMLCKFRSSNMSVLQRMISLLLYAAHSGTIVS